MKFVFKLVIAIFVVVFDRGICAAQTNPVAQDIGNISDSRDELSSGANTAATKVKKKKGKVKKKKPTKKRRHRRHHRRAKPRDRRPGPIVPIVTPITIPTAAPIPTPPPPIAADVKTSWEQRMREYGRVSCEKLKDPSLTDDQRLSQVFYDAQWVFYQIGDYTDDSYWHDCAELASSVYRDNYALLFNGSVPGYWNFTDGLTQDFLRNGDELSKQAAILISQQASYARDGTPLEWTADSTLSREVAYAIIAYLNAEDLGEPRRARLEPLVDQALGHLDQWFGPQTAPWLRPFMAGLTFHALIEYFKRTGDPRVIPALVRGADWLWEHTWVPEAQAFRYTDRIINPGDLDPAPDLNQLIAPAYAFLYHQTGEARFLERGDQIFTGGVQGAYLNNGKQFDQSYRGSFEYVTLREQAPLTQPQ